MSSFGGFVLFSFPLSVMETSGALPHIMLHVIFYYQIINHFTDIQVNVYINTNIPIKSISNCSFAIFVLCVPSFTNGKLFFCYSILNIVLMPYYEERQAAEAILRAGLVIVSV